MKILGKIFAPAHQRTSAPAHQRTSAPAHQRNSAIGPVYFPVPVTQPASPAAAPAFSIHPGSFSAHRTGLSLFGFSFSVDGKPFSLDGKSFSVDAFSFSVDGKPFSLDGFSFSVDGKSFPEPLLGRGFAGLPLGNQRFTPKMPVLTPPRHERCLLGFWRSTNVLGESEPRMGHACLLPQRARRPRLCGPFSVGQLN